MAPRVNAGGGLAAILYSTRLARKRGFFRLLARMRSRNACKTCALGMGGAKGGMVNEAGHFPEVCKKSLQAGDIRSALLLGGNLHGASPDSRWTREALERIGTIVHVSTKLNTGHALARRGGTTVILPALTRDEERQWTT